MADIPGLIEGAHAGVGLGDEFLRHIERTRLLVHMVDVCPLAGECVEDYFAIRRELAEYSASLAAKPEVLVANKIDLPGSKDNLRRLEKETGRQVIAVSALAGTGLKRLTEHLWQLLQQP